jgi:predicted flap endonuclease-1-like 5' DNA nuclease
MSYPITHIDGVGPEQAMALKRAGIRTTGKFLEAAKNTKGRRALSLKTGIDEQCLLKWANMADRMRIKGIGNDYAELLRAAGVDTVRELKRRNAERLLQAMRSANEKRKLVQLLPSPRAVQRWIEAAQKLPLKITY